ncbi:MAG TPA: hypothetical protein VF487_12380 [Chitinophagaceae bacterium]
MNVTDIKALIFQKSSDLFRGRFESLSSAEIGDPIEMFDDEEIQRFWFTGLFRKKRVVGRIIQDLSGKIVLHGFVTPNVSSEEERIEEGFLKEPPEKIIAAINKTYPDGILVSQFFSFDKVPQKWGWLIKFKKNDKKNTQFFIAPNGWHELRSSNKNSTSEG